MKLHKYNFFHKNPPANYRWALKGDSKEISDILFTEFETYENPFGMKENSTIILSKYIYSYPRLQNSVSGYMKLK
jgi:hypothetical protein